MVMQIYRMICSLSCKENKCDALFDKKTLLPLSNLDQLGPEVVLPRIDDFAFLGNYLNEARQDAPAFPRLGKLQRVVAPFSLDWT